MKITLARRVWRVIEADWVIHRVRESAYRNGSQGCRIYDYHGTGD